MTVPRLDGDEAGGTEHSPAHRYRVSRETGPER